VTTEYVAVPVRIPQDIAAELAKLGDLVDVANEIKDLGTTVLEGLREGQGGSNYKLVAYILSAKAFKTFQAAQLLCLCGYGSDALSLCASLFENIIDLLYMGKAPVLRPLRYMQYEQVEKFWKAERLLSRKRLPRGRRNAYRKHHQTLAPQTAKLLKYFPNKGKGWSQKSLFERAKALGVAAEVDYNEKYWIYCGHKHTLPMSASGWTIELPEGGIDLTQGPDAKEVFNGMSESATLFWQLCVAIDDAFALSLKPRIEEIWKKFKDATEAVVQKYPELL
jgi:hypothetical protein